MTYMDLALQRNIKTLSLVKDVPMRLSSNCDLLLNYGGQDLKIKMTRHMGNYLQLLEKANTHGFKEQSCRGLDQVSRGL